MVHRPRELRAVLLAVALGCAGGADGDAGLRNLLLISVDTLRADHLGSYGHPRPTSPWLDALAAEGVLFEEALATAPWTLPSHASLLTGLYPSRHGVRTLHHALPREVPTLASRLTGEGYATGAVINQFYLTRHHEVVRGFEEVVPLASDQTARGAARRIARKGLQWLGDREEPWFLFLHFFDVHSDYRSRPQVERRFVRRRSPKEGSTLQLMEISDGLEPLTDERAERLARLYDAGIRQLDGELERLFAALERRDRLAETLVVVTSDHGEEFGEHGGVSHGRTHYREMLHVPLLLRGPGIPAGRRVDEPVSVVDVVPTALDLLGVEPPPDLDGRSLRPLWTGKAEGSGARALGEPRALFAEAAPGTTEDTLAAVRVGRYKLVVDQRSGERELYDLRADPAERDDLSAERPALADRLERRLAAHRARQRPPRRAEDLPPRRLEHLRALGYVVAPAPPDAGAAGDPGIR